MKVQSLDRIVLSILGLLALAFIGLTVFGLTRGVQVISVQPQEGSEVSALTIFSFEFSTAMDRRSVEERFRIQPDVAGEFSWDGLKMCYQPSHPLKPGQTYEIAILDGARSEDGRDLHSEARSEFIIRTPDIFYLSPAYGAYDLWLSALPPETGDPIQLTQTGGLLFDYALSPDGSRVSYSVQNSNKGLDLWMMELVGEDPWLLVECGIDRCKSPAWSPDGVWIAYGREVVSSGSEEGAQGASRIWTVEVETGQTAALYQDSQVLGYEPSWSPDGSRLAFFDSSAGGIRILHLETGEEEVLPSQMGQVGTWSPDGNQMVFSIMKVIGNQAYADLQLADLSVRSVSPFFEGDVSPGDYGSPVWSPGGEDLLFGLQSAESGPGRQLWLADSSGQSPSPVVVDPGFTHGGYRWNPWGTGFVYQRIALSDPAALPEVWMFDLEVGESVLIAEDAWLPAWLP